MPVERREQVTRVGIDRVNRQTGGTRWFRRKAAAFKGGTSRVSREAQARFCERLGVQFPGATRRVGSHRKVSPSLLLYRQICFFVGLRDSLASPALYP